MNRTPYDYQFYENANGESDTYDFLETLAGKAAKGDKASRILVNSIYRRLGQLKRNGTRDGMPDFEFFPDRKHSLWQIRVKHTTGYFRCFICLWKQNTYIILNYYCKKSLKTPPNEIGRAERLMTDFIGRNGG